MSNQEYSFIQSTEESIKNYNKLKEILLVDKNEINFTSINSNIKKIILEIITKCLCYNRHKRISLNEIINQIDYIYDRYIKEKPMKIDTMNIINRDNLMQLNAPIINISLNPYKSNKNTLNSNNSINDSNNIDISNEENNDINIDNNNNDNIILSTSNQQKNYDSFISDRYSSASMMWNNNNMNNRNINNNFNFNKNFSKFGSLSSISSNKNYNKQQYFTSMTNNNNFNNNATNISERFSDGNSQIKNQYEQTVYTNTEINRKIKESTDGEYAKLQNRKYIFLIFYFLLFRIG
jgi:serine/threonine protein kinase